MNDEPKLCDRCGGRIGSKSAHIDIFSSDSDGAEPKSSLDVCKECGNSLTRWIARGPAHALKRKRRAKASEQAKKKTSKRRKFRVAREHIALAIVIILSVIFCLYITRSSGE